MEFRAAWAGWETIARDDANGTYHICGFVGVVEMRTCSDPVMRRGYL